MENNQYIRFCKCGCGNGVVLKFDKYDNDLSLQLVSDLFYVNQGGKFTIKEKLKRIWRIMVNKEYCYFDMLMDNKDLQEFKDFVAKL